MKASNKDIVELLRKVVTVYKIEKKEPFRTGAYENAADTIEILSDELYELWKQNKLDQVDGLGESIRGHILELFEKGSSEFFERQIAKVPSTVFLLTKVPKVGPIRAYQLVTQFKLFDEKTAIQKLIKLCEEHKISELPGFGKQSQQALLDSLKQFLGAQSSPDRIPYDYAKTVSDDLVQYLKRNPLVKRVDVLGSLRRRNLTIGDIDIAVQADTKKAPEIVKYFIAYPKKLSVDNAGDEKASIYIPPKLRIDLRVQPKKSYGTMLAYFTGSKAHNIKLREYALQKGYSVNEYGIKDLRSEDHKNKAKGKEANTILFESEEKLYNFLGLHYIEPEKRVGGNEIEKAEFKKGR